ncbi:hypothetical protein AR546_05475 [Leptospira interrogans serovar Canicola]|nr:hypothetical protein [Leptospira interrogans serovar Canicola]OLZ32347.1 hypothetical protein AR546_05475 [Leptospira interrogans serovar Canicola]POR17586.1 hypothetical protein B0T34_14210 [Leptospira interrogans serovar Canicola]
MQKQINYSSLVTLFWPKNHRSFLRKFNKILRNAFVVFSKFGKVFCKVGILRRIESLQRSYRKWSYDLELKEEIGYFIASWFKILTAN